MCPPPLSPARAARAAHPTWRIAPASSQRFLPVHHHRGVRRTPRTCRPQSSDQTSIHVWPRCGCGVWGGAVGGEILFFSPVGGGRRAAGSRAAPRSPAPATPVVTHTGDTTPRSRGGRGGGGGLCGTLARSSRSCTRRVLVVLTTWCAVQLQYRWADAVTAGRPLHADGRVFGQRCGWLRPRGVSR